MIKVPLKAKWQVQANSILVNTCIIFGWKVFQHIMPTGAKLITHASAEIERGTAPNISMYVRGSATTVTTALEGAITEHPNRYPGLFSAERPNHPAGISVTTALEETEFWCFNWLANRKAHPILTPIRLLPNDTFEIVTGQNIFIMSGASNISSGTFYFTATENLTLIAETEVYGFIIESER